MNEGAASGVAGGENGNDDVGCAGSLGRKRPRQAQEVDRREMSEDRKVTRHGETGGSETVEDELEFA